MLVIVALGVATNSNGAKPGWSRRWSPSVEGDRARRRKVASDGWLINRVGGIEAGGQGKGVTSEVIQRHWVGVRLL